MVHACPSGGDHVHLLTFDVEHWYEGFRHRGLSGWENYPLRDDRVVDQLLDLLGVTGQRATFFFTGRYARDFPQIVQRAAGEGHEIASHSYSHIVLSRLGGKEAFRKDLLSSVEILQNMGGQPIKGYRAPKWSIADGNRDDVLSTLVEAGLEYDSSEFPRFLGGSINPLPHRVQLAGGATIWEVPAATLPFGKLRFPVAGGLYFRLLPLWATRAAFTARQKIGQPCMIYLHPYDLDADCPRIPGGNPLFRSMRYYGIRGSWDRLGMMLKQYKFTTIQDYLSKQEPCPTPILLPKHHDP